jgi:transcriptional regulator with XRE-family HTH domain
MPEAGLCPACQAAPLSSRRSPLCVACTDAARAPVAQPLWLFDSPLLRRALAQVNLSAVPAIIRAASGLSQSDLAAIAGWSRGALGLYERGQRGAVFDIRVVLQFADAVGMPREALLPLVLGDADAALTADSAVDETGVGVDRRRFGGLTVGITVAAILPEPAIPSRVSASHIKYLQACVDSLYSRDRILGGGGLLMPALRLLHRSRKMLRESGYTEATGVQLLRVAGRLAACGGWLAFDAGNVSLARHLYAEAQLLAGKAEDTNLAVQALAQSSMLASYAARVSDNINAKATLAREGLSLANQAADEARYEPFPRLHALIALRHAYAAELLGNNAAFRSAITRARRELDRGPHNTDPDWVTFVSATEITASEAGGYRDLGEPARSEELYRTALDGNLPPRDRANHSAGLALALLDQDAKAHAVDAGMAVLPALEGGVTSIRTLNALRPIRVAARNVNNDEFCARFDAAERALTATYSPPRLDT